MVIESPIAADMPEIMTEIPHEKWPKNMPLGLCRVFMSKQFLAQMFAHKSGAFRLTICRTSREGGNWTANITWDDLQQIKRECGFGDRWAVEIFPADDHLVNVANMRHLFIVDSAPSFAWKKAKV